MLQLQKQRQQMKNWGVKRREFQRPIGLHQKV